MPLIQVRLVENVFTPKQKQEMISKLTDAMVTIEGENMRQVTCVSRGPQLLFPPTWRSRFHERQRRKLSRGIGVRSIR
jgi:tautomerase-like protein